MQQVKSEPIEIDDKKSIVSMRLSNSDRLAVRSTASRLHIRESELYRFAICFLLRRLDKLHDDTYTGSDLLPLLLEFREELDIHLKLNKQQLFNIINSRNTATEKFVPMLDIELLIMPEHATRQRLSKMPDAVDYKDANTGKWLITYLNSKYNFLTPISEKLAE